MDVDLFILCALLGHRGHYSVGTRDLPRGQICLEVDCSCASSTQVKTEWSYTFLPPLHGVCRDKVTFATSVLCGKKVG